MTIHRELWATAPIAEPDREVKPTDVPVLVINEDGTNGIIHIDRAVVWRVADSIMALPTVNCAMFPDHEWDGHERAYRCTGECDHHGV